MNRVNFSVPWRLPYWQSNPYGSFDYSSEPPAVCTMPYVGTGSSRTMSLDEAFLWGTTPSMDALAEIAYQNAFGHYASSRTCLRAVRTALNESGIDGASSMGRFPTEAVDYFRGSDRYIEILGVGEGDIPSLPRGTIVLYTHPTVEDWSHAQIMLGWDTAASDYLHDSRVYSANDVGDVWAFVPSEETLQCEL